MYLAHKKDNKIVQTVKEHSLNTANLCRDYSVNELKNFMSKIISQAARN